MVFYPFLDNTERIAMTYNGLTLNDPTDEPNDIYEINIVSLEPQWVAVTEPKTLTHGLEVYFPRKVQNLLRATGIVRGPTFGALFDKVLALNAAFDPVVTYRGDFNTTRNRGFTPFASSIPTADDTNYPTGVISAYINARSMKQPVTRSSQYDGLACRFDLALLAADPRVYYSVAQTATRSNAGTMDLDNDLANFPSWPTITIDLSGTGHGVVSFSLTSSVETVVFRLDLTGLGASDTVVVDSENREVLLNGVVDMSLYYNGDYWTVGGGETSTLTIANVSGTLAGSVTVDWDRAIG